MSTSPDLDRVLLHIADGLREVVDPAEVTFLEAKADQTLVFGPHEAPRMDVRPIGQLLPYFEPYGFLRLHRSYAVNLRKVGRIQRRTRGRDWEVVLLPPHDRVLPVSRSAQRELMESFEPRDGRP